MPTPERGRPTWLSRYRLLAFGCLATLVALGTVVAVASPIEPTAVPTRDQKIADRPAPAPLAARTKAPRAARPITVVGIGDSVTAGSNCDCTSFVKLYATKLALQRGLRTSSANWGMDGWTSSQLLQSLTRPGTLRDQVAKADIVLVTIGANDLLPLSTGNPTGCTMTCYSALVSGVGRNVERIVASALAVRPVHPPTVLVTNYWNVFEDGDVGTAKNGPSYQRWSDALTRAENSQICQGAQRAGATCVDLYAPFKDDGSKNPTSLLASDGDHPDAAGHLLIASTLLAKTPMPVP